MPEVPTPREFGRLLRRMDLPARAHLNDLASKGKAGRDPTEAALVAAAARRGLRGRWWIVILNVVLICLVIVSSVRIQGSVHWSAALLVAVSVIGIPIALIRNRRPLQRAERINRKLAAENGE
jgi:transposase InsO family protein